MFSKGFAVLIFTMSREPALVSVPPLRNFYLAQQTHQVCAKERRRYDISTLLLTTSTITSVNIFFFNLKQVYTWHDYVDS